MRAIDQPKVIAAHSDDLHDMVELAVTYEWDSPAAAWLVPDVHSRPAVLMAWYTIQAEQALRCGYVDMTRDRRAAAFWLDRTRPHRLPANHLRRVALTCGRYAIRLLTYEQLLVQHQ